ncbi:GAF domain-containing protein [Kitasatospora sp. SolWspMP-SS2h]|uniref:SpoIIE family protein phosphatase n=1 Tax=Kitasatospora sp. SolWspMP-SS2h TaxID=1305729 RepID=UPI000DBF6944|nr:SpoIIE family protein phosphatase [Kitasatospora sp. SolWspMP-SS2h]RAJ38522.1 GAF domain-containing protein [Kitasatospora sp. SolWspMP-SS2h]
MDQDQSSPRRASRSELRCVRALLRASSAAELLAALLAEGPAWITGEGSALYLLDDGGALRLTASHGLPAWAHRKYAVVDPAGGLPAALALRRREPVLLSPQRTSADYPNAAVGLGTGLVALAVLPLVVDGDPVGSLALALAHRGAVPRRDVELLETFADVVAHRLAHLLDHVRAADPAAAGPRPEIPPADGQLVSLAVRSAGAGAFERDLVTGETVWDAQAYRVVGLPPPGATGRAPDLADVVHPEDLPDVQAALAEALAAGGPYRVSYRVVRPDGTTWQVDEAGEVMLDVHRRPVRTAGLVTGREWRPGPAGGPAAAAAAGARSTLLLALTRALSRAVTVREVTTALTDVARPALGAAGVVLDLVDEGRLTPVSPAVFGGPHRAELNRLHDLAGGVMEHVLARAAPLFSEPGRERRGPEEPAAWTVLPLVASGRQVGSCLITFATERAFSREDRTMYSAFAGILAQSLERARLYDVHHERASELQRAMLPRSLPALPGIASAARYLPSTEGMRIGGDWYDLLRLPGGLVGLVIGDVQGHHAEATAVMGQLRSVLWAYATEGNDPAAALERTGRLLAEMETELFATCLYVVLDPASGLLRAARAGHPPPVRIGAAGAAELELPGGPPLGVLPEVRYPLVEARLEPGETLLAYTDGLVEVRDEDYDESVQRMLGGLELWTAEAGGARRLGRPGALERLADLLTLNVTERAVRQDDVALLLLHRMAS